MRILLAGATGAIGTPLLRLLVAGGHEVTGMTRSPEKAAMIRAAGAEAVLADALDSAAVEHAVTAARPQAIVNQLTAIPPRLDPRRILRDFALTDRLRTEGTHNLIAAAEAIGGARILAQSIAFAYAPGPSGTIHDETDPLTVDPPVQFKRSAAAIAELERTVLAAKGVVLRYGYFYGPGTAISRDGSIGTDLARRRLPIVGGGGGVWSFIHIEDAATATVAALDSPASATYNIVDEEPAPVAKWLTGLAQALGAPRPLQVPAWLARPFAGSYGVATMTSAQGASGARARSELGWTPAYSSWREGFRSGLG
jgi:nucleoside-diphosphate-sugar epimerase